MTIKDALTTKVSEFAADSWGSIPQARVLPTINDLSFGNSGERISVSILYADISRSTQLVDSVPDTQAAGYYKAFLHCASQLINRNKGEIQAYDGDRVMAVYVGDDRANAAIGTALDLHYAVAEIINPIFQRVYGASHRKLQFTAGIDTGQVLAIKVGIRAVGDLAWIGGAANYAAKLNSFSGLDHDYPIRATQQTMDLVVNPAELGLGHSGMWEGPYNDLVARDHYRTKWWRTL